MIITTIRIHGRSEKRKEILQTLIGMSEQLQSHKGCARSGLYQDLEDKDTFYFMEEWRTEKDLERYKGSRSLAALLGLEPLLEESIEVKYAVKL